MSVKTHESIKGRISANTLDWESDVNRFIKCNYRMTWSSLYFDLAFDALPHCVIYCTFGLITGVPC